MSFWLQARRAGTSLSLNAITSEATSLGALRVAERLLERCLEEVDNYNKFNNSVMLLSPAVSYLWRFLMRRRKQVASGEI